MNTLRAEEPLLSYYQMDHDPFAARVPNFKFFPAQRKTILGQLHHLSRHSQLILLITGPKGSGKTLLRQALIASINKETVKIVSVSAVDCAKVNDVLQLLANELTLAESTVVSVIEQIKLMLNKGISLYLMIDDADQLSEDVLQLLINLSNEQLSNLHIFLFARPNLLDKLESSVMGKEVTFNLPLTPYTLEETKEYLALRLEGAGQNLSLFTESQIMDIYTQSSGWPGNINQVAGDCLIENMQNHQLSAEPDFDDDYAARKSTKVPTMPKLPLSNKHLAIVGVIAVCLVAILLFSNKTPDTQPSTTVTTIDTQAIPTVTTDDQTSQDIPLPTTTASNEVLADNNTAPAVEPTTAPVVANPTTPEEPAVTSAPPNEEIKAPANTPIVAPTHATTKPETVATTKPNTVKPPVSTHATTTKTGNAWYRAQQGAHFTIQVSVASSEKAAKELLAKQGSNYHYFKRSRSGKVDYVITYGDYAKRTDAQAAIKKLPTPIQQSKPWVRTFASIKQELAN